MAQGTNQAPASQGPGSDQKSKGASLTEQSRLALIRYVGGEFARVVVPIPAGKQGFHLKAGAPLDEKELRAAVVSEGAAINPGDTAQITNLGFCDAGTKAGRVKNARCKKDSEIVVDINGGGRGKQSLRDRIHLEVGGIPSVQVSDPVKTVNPKAGATLVLDFDKSLPDLTPDELKSDLSALLDFSKSRSAAVQWLDTLPPDIQNAIKDKRPALGMDRDMVLAAMGHPDRKVRERTPDGDETEDWIYGKPPERTVFVTFEGEKVIQVQQFPH